ncbi:hypothetical protein PIB30_003090 [Stylosanthes scabra]|uniref:Agenet domain-containing protein n=1 Tax=Stylosanthes scabra TaxID=79078 RepID=A0ABU6Y4Z4_9FABA|nr:hypothetical protein [Stylosanthes scabra]
MSDNFVHQVMKLGRLNQSALLSRKYLQLMNILGTALICPPSNEDYNSKADEEESSEEHLDNLPVREKVERRGKETRRKDRDVWKVHVIGLSSNCETDTMRLKKGSQVEVLASAEGPCVEFRCARILSGNGRTYSVEYECSSITCEAGVQRVQRKAIRPCPPLIEGVESWEACDVVEVYDAGCWKVATILKVLGRDFYLVRCLSSCKQLKVRKDSMRVRQSWINDQWIINQQGLGNSGGGKSSCNLISNSYKVVPEVQQVGTRTTQQDGSDCFSSTNASALYEPFGASFTGLKRMSPCGYSAVDTYPKKMRAVINKGPVWEALPCFQWLNIMLGLLLFTLQINR